eukprot:220165-Prymnesium_polylepis.1
MPRSSGGLNPSTMSRPVGTASPERRSPSSAHDRQSWSGLTACACGSSSRTSQATRLSVSTTFR